MNAKTKIRNRDSRNKGLTLIELIVASAIIVILILAVGRILAQVQMMVRVSQSAISADARASATGNILYQDIRRASQQGFICITQAADNSPKLVVCDGGPTPSMTGGTIGNGGLACVGQGASSASGSVIWHAMYVLGGAGGLDSSSYDLATLQSWNRATISATVDTIGSPGAFIVPPNNLGDITALWDLLDTYVSELSIMWTDGTTNPATTTALNWYGVDCINGVWSVVQKDTASLGADSTRTEFAVGGKYRALFSHDNPAYWPTAIKIRFKLTDPNAPKEFDTGNGNGMYYEIICPVSQ